MNKLPYVLVKCAVSIDGYLDDTSSERLKLSNEKDFDRVDEERTKCDAILLGAETIRKDNPKAVIKSEKRRKQRLQNGKEEDLIKVTITMSGNLESNLRYFTTGNAKKIIYCSNNNADSLKSRFEHLVEIVPFPKSTVDPIFLLSNLYSRGVRKLMIEGGSKILTTFLSKGLVDELQISIAPFFVGDPNAPKFVNESLFLHNKDNRMTLANVEQIGDIAMMTYYFK